MSFDSEKVFSPLFGAFPNSQRVWLSKGADGLCPGGQSASCFPSPGPQDTSVGFCSGWQQAKIVREP